MEPWKELYFNCEECETPISQCNKSGSYCEKDMELAYKKGYEQGIKDVKHFVLNNDESMNIRVKLYNPNYSPGKKEYILGTLRQSIDYGGDKQYFGIQVDGMRCDYNKNGLFWFRKGQLRIEKYDGR